MQAAVLVQQLFAPVPGGTGRYTADLVEALGLARPPDSAVVRWAASDAPGSARRPGDPAAGTVPEPRAVDRRLPWKGRWLSLAWPRGIGPQPHDCDVIHAPTLLAPARRDVPVVVTLHDDVPWTHPHTLTRHGARWHRRMGSRVAGGADLVVVPSAAVADRLLARLPALRADRVLVAANPLPPTRLRALSRTLPDEDAHAARLGLPAEGFLLFVGTREPRKGLDVLLSALGRALGPRLPVLLVGVRGWGDVDVSSGRQRVHVRERLDDVELGVVYRRATAVVLPSRAEGFGYPVVEAMAAGVPVVTSDDPALVETGAGAALATPVGDAPALAEALRRIEDDPGLRAELSARGRARAADFAADRYGRLLWDAYRSVARC